MSEEIFADVAAETGLDFVHDNGMSGERFIVEIMGSGAALLDYDNDGDLDVYLVQGGPLGRDGTAAAFVGDRLYRNELPPGLPPGEAAVTALRFVDVTEESGLDATGYGMAVASGDYDDDGWVDLYVTNFGANQLWHNEGVGEDGRVSFRDRTEASGTGDPRWSVPAAFVDFDRDGRLDLFVGNYLDFRLSLHRDCFSPSGQLDWCGPLAFDPVPDRLFRNLGGGRFADVTLRAGLRTAWGRALGVLPADFDGDGWLDLYVANDSDENQLWVNRGDGTFRNEALLAGCAVNEKGQAEASMGVDAADFDGDGDEDLFVTHLDQETNTIYRNDGRGQFRDHTLRSGLGQPSWDRTGFGTAWLDYDNDGRLDLLVANGAVRSLAALSQQGDPYPLHQPNQLFRGLEDGRFQEVTAEAGSVFELSETSRGLAIGDIDNDGDVDVLVTNSNGSPRLLRNGVGNRNHWLGLRLVGPSGRDMLGAWVALRRDGGGVSGRDLRRRVRTAGSYASASDPRLLFGLGPEAGVLRVEVRWPQGRVEQWTGLDADRYVTLRQGEGTAPGDG